MITVSDMTEYTRRQREAAWENRRWLYRSSPAAAAAGFIVVCMLC